MSDSAMDTIKSLLGDNAEEKIKAVLGSLSENNNSQSQDVTDKKESNLNTEKDIPSQGTNDSGVDIGSLNSIMQIKGIIDNLSNSNNDSRSNLLMSLRPYMRSSRQGSIDTAIRLLNISKLSDIFKLR